MNEEKGRSYLEKNSSKLKFSYINDSNKSNRLSNTQLSEETSKKISNNNLNNIVSPLEIVKKNSNMKRSLFMNTNTIKNTNSNPNINSIIRNTNSFKNSNSIINANNIINNNCVKNTNNNLGFIPHFGKGLHKAKNSSNNLLNNIVNNENISSTIKLPNQLSSTIIKNNVNYDLNSHSEESLENEKNLKMVEKEIKNRIMDMSNFLQDNNRSLVLAHKKNLDFFSIEEESSTKKRRKKKKNKKKKEENIDKDRKIIKKKALYDSLDEEEDLQENDDSDFFIINPEGRFAFTLDCIILISSFFCFLYIPLQISFSKCFCIEEKTYTKILLLLIDAIFIFDFFSSFFRAFYNYEYKLIKDIKHIIKHYLKGMFFIELLQAIPMNLIIIYLCHNKAKYQPDGPVCFYNGINGNYASIKLFSLIKISKAIKAMDKKNNKAYLWLTEIDDHIFEKIFRLLSFTLISLASINVFICLHIFIGYQTYPNWLISMGIQDKSFIQIYIAALYGIIETLTTVGYGDVVCDSFTEIIFQIILLSIGIVAYSWIITIIGNYVKNESKAEIKHSKDLTMLEEIRVEFPKMSFKLYNKIHQHLQSVSNQQKKVDLNILVNSLPYSVKNMVLFKVYNKCIKKFVFFKKCDNTDFISRVLTNFIPLFSMKKALLIREGELVENIFFVKTGKLSLNVAIDPDNPEDSIKRYIYEKFEDIMDNDNTNKNNKTTTRFDKINTINKTNTLKNSENINPGLQNIENIFNQKKTLGQSYHESRIEQEIGKCDLGGSEDFEEKYKKFLRIMDINRNENFGTTYMQLNKPSPLSLRVVSKKADIFLLRKHDVIIISKAYSTIWRKISEKALANMIAIKDKTIKTLKNYCAYNGILLDDKIPEKNRKLDPINLFEIKELMEIERMKQKKENNQKIKNKASKLKTNKLKPILKKPLKKSHSLVLKNKEIVEKIKKKLIKKFSHENTNLLFVKSFVFNKHSCKENKVELKTTELEPINEGRGIAKSRTKLSNYNIEYSSKIKNTLGADQLIIESQKESVSSSSDSNKLEETNKIYDNESEKSYPKTLDNLPPEFASFLKKKIIKRKKNKNKKYYKLMCIQLIDKLNNIINNNSNKKNEINLKNGFESSTNIINANNCNNSIYKSNNYYISNSNIIFPFPDEINKNKSLISSFSKASQSKNFDSTKLSIDKNSSFEIKSVYHNLNYISKGKYEKDYEMQKETEKFIKYFKKNEFKKSMKTPKIKTNKDNFFSLLDDNISEIKSNSIHENDNKNIDNQEIISNSKKKSLKKLNVNKKNKKVKFVKQNTNIEKMKKNKSTSNKNKESSSLSIYNNSLNNLETSDNKIIKEKNIKFNGIRVAHSDNNESKTFIKKIFQKEKSKKENNSASKSNDILNDFNILNHENELRNINNYEELKEKTLNKLKMDNKEKNFNKTNKEEKEKGINDYSKKNDYICIIF